MQIDPDTQYDGVDGQVRWEKRADDTFDGYIDLEKIFDKGNNWNTVLCLDFCELTGRAKS